MDVQFALDEATPVFVISVAARLAGMHPQTLRQYDRLGLVSPGRTSGRGRRYSPRDVALLREVQRLSQEEGVNLAGIKRILELETENGALRARLALLEAELVELHDGGAGRLAERSRVFAAGPAGVVVAMPRGRRPSAFSRDRAALVVWRPRSRIGR